MNFKKLFKFSVPMIIIVALLFTACDPVTTSTTDKTKSSVKNKLELFSWWTSGGEADGLASMTSIYKDNNPGVEVINATIAGGAGSNAKAVLKTRMMGGNPPDAFQVHAGQEIAGWVEAGKLEQLDDLYTTENWENTFPKGLLDILKIEGHYYSVPVNIHRSNVLWYNKKIFSANGLKPPKDYNEFFSVAERLKSKNIIPMALGDNAQWVDVHVFENILLGYLGQKDYIGLWKGEIAWNDQRITKSLETFKQMMNYVNTDHSALSWDQSAQYMIDGKAAMIIMGDWADGFFISKKFSDYDWTPAPGTDKTFLMLSDTFALPKNIKNSNNAKEWLKFCGSVKGQDTFNPLKGSIPARIDAGKGNYDNYLKSAMKDWSSNLLAPSCAHGAAVKEGWVTDITDTLGLFVTKKDVAATQKSLIKLAEKNK